MAKVKPGQVKITQDTVKTVIASIRQLSRTKVMVGIPSTTAQRAPDPENPIPPNNALIGYWMEYGTVKAPARPWLIPGMKKAQARVIVILRKTAMKALDGDPTVVERGLMATGLYAQGEIKNYIINGHFIPLAKYTLERRKARGVTRTEPLRDTLQMLNSVNYVLRVNGQD